MIQDSGEDCKISEQYSVVKCMNKQYSIMRSRVERHKTNSIVL